MLSPTDQNGQKLRFTVVFEPPISELFLQQCKTEQRNMTSMIRVIVKHYCENLDNRPIDIGRVVTQALEDYFGGGSNERKVQISRQSL